MDTLAAGVEMFAFFFCFFAFFASSLPCWTLHVSRLSKQQRKRLLMNKVSHCCCAIICTICGKATKKPIHTYLSDGALSGLIINDISHLMFFFYVT